MIRIFCETEEEFNLLYSGDFSHIQDDCVVYMNSEYLAPGKSLDSFLIENFIEDNK